MDFVKISFTGGDFCLVYSDFFLLGMIFFLAAQVSFIKAFLFEPLKPMIGVSIAIILTLALSLLILPNISDFGLKLGFPLYSMYGLRNDVQSAVYQKEVNFWRENTNNYLPQ